MISQVRVYFVLGTVREENSSRALTSQSSLEDVGSQFASLLQAGGVGRGLVGAVQGVNSLFVRSITARDSQKMMISLFSMPSFKSLQGMPAAHSPIWLQVMRQMVPMVCILPLIYKEINAQ